MADRIILQCCSLSKARGSQRTIWLEFRIPKRKYSIILFSGDIAKQISKSLLLVWYLVVVLVLWKSLVFSSGLGRMVAFLYSANIEFIRYPVSFLFSVSTCSMPFFVLDTKKKG